MGNATDRGANKERSAKPFRSEHAYLNKGWQDNQTDEGHQRDTR